MRRESGKRKGGRERKGEAGVLAMSCPDSLPILIYMYPQGNLYKFSILTAKNAKWLPSALRRKVG